MKVQGMAKHRAAEIGNEQGVGEQPLPQRESRSPNNFTYGRVALVGGSLRETMLWSLEWDEFWKPPPGGYD